MFHEIFQKMLYKLHLGRLTNKIMDVYIPLILSNYLGMPKFAQQVSSFNTCCKYNIHKVKTFTHSIKAARLSFFDQMKKSKPIQINKTIISSVIKEKETKENNKEIDNDPENGKTVMNAMKHIVGGLGNSILKKPTKSLLRVKRTTSTPSSPTKSSSEESPPKNKTSETNTNSNVQDLEQENLLKEVAFSIKKTNIE